MNDNKKIPTSANATPGSMRPQKSETQLLEELLNDPNAVHLHYCPDNGHDYLCFSAHGFGILRKIKDDILSKDQPQDDEDDDEDEDPLVDAISTLSREGRGGYHCTGVNECDGDYHAPILSYLTTKAPNEMKAMMEEANAKIDTAKGAFLGGATFTTTQVTLTNAALLALLDVLSVYPKEYSVLRKTFEHCECIVSCTVDGDVYERVRGFSKRIFNEPRHIEQSNHVFVDFTGLTGIDLRAALRGLLEQCLKHWSTDIIDENQPGYDSKCYDNNHVCSLTPTGKDAFLNLINFAEKRSDVVTDAAIRDSLSGIEFNYNVNEEVYEASPASTRAIMALFRHLSPEDLCHVAGKLAMEDQGQSIPLRRKIDVVVAELTADGSVIPLEKAKVQKQKLHPVWD